MTVGQQYLTSLRESASRQRERQSKARALSVQMHRMFLPLAEEITCKRMDSGKMLLDIAHLIDNKTVERYQNKYTSATAADEGVPDAAFRSLAAVSLCAPHATHISTRNRVTHIWIKRGSFSLHRDESLAFVRLRGTAHSSADVTDYPLPWLRASHTTMVVQRH